jgi:regulator of sigma E protease
LVCIKTTIKFIGSLFKGKGDVSQLGGPIKIVKISGQVLEFGIVAFFSVIAYISISLGLINLFPIPLLDGGHLMFFLFEKILGRPLKQKTRKVFFESVFFTTFTNDFCNFNDLKDWGLFQ